MGIILDNPRHRFFAKATFDAASWAVALWCAWKLRLDLWGSGVDHRRLLELAVLAAVLHGLVGLALGLYPRRYRYASFDEVTAMVRTGLAVGALLFVINLAAPEQLAPRSVPLIATALAVGLMAGQRFVIRVRQARARRPNSDRLGRVVVFGAGEGAEQILPTMLRNPDSPYLPVALVDDDPWKRSYSLFGVRVAGTLDDLPRVAEHHRATHLLVAIPSADAELIRRASAAAAAAGLKLLVLPPVHQLLGGLGLADIKPVTEADLLGRRQIDTDLASIAHYLTGKRVLVTGAGGSIGSEIARQVRRYEPAELILLDRDESALHAVQLSIEGRALLDDPNLVLADIRDSAAIDRLFAERRPEVVFHAAALKHLPMLERHPDEAVKTNVVGTFHLLAAARAYGVERFVNISTDKAADPTSVLGRSKRLAERLTADAAATTGLPFVSVRFGNVLGSRGSVLPAFRAQIEAGGPVTVTHPDVTRYFMTVEEAVQLTIQAGAIGRPGEVLVLDMGRPVRIAEVAERLIAQADRPVRIEYTGLRPGEKLHEVLLGADEPDERPFHPLISHVPVPPLGIAEAMALCDSGWLATGVVDLTVAPAGGGWTVAEDVA